MTIQRFRHPASSNGIWPSTPASRHTRCVMFGCTFDKCPISFCSILHIDGSPICLPFSLYHTLFYTHTHTHSLSLSLYLCVCVCLSLSLSLSLSLCLSVSLTLSLSLSHSVSVSDSVSISLFPSPALSVYLSVSSLFSFFCVHPSHIHTLFHANSFSSAYQHATQCSYLGCDKQFSQGDNCKTHERTCEWRGVDPERVKAMMKAQVETPAGCLPNSYEME